MITVSDPKATTPKVAVLIGSGTVQVYDLTKAEAPVRVGALKTPSGRATRAALHGSHAFVADFREGLQVIDLSNPKALRVVANLLRPDGRPEAEDQVAIGKRVRVIFQDLADHLALPQFTLSGEAPDGRVWRFPS